MEVRGDTILDKLIGVQRIIGKIYLGQPYERGCALLDAIIAPQNHEEVERWWDSVDEYHRPMIRMLELASPGIAISDIAKEHQELTN